MATTLELTVRTAAWTRPSRELVRAFEAFPVANIGDAMERIGIVDGRIGTVWAGARCVGAALPVLGAAGDNAAVIEALNYIEPGDVVVINGFGHEHRALVGEQLSQRFAAAGATGAVIDGYIRDRATIAEIKFPVFARGVTPAGPFKNGPGVIGEAVAIGGIVCAAGDIVAADDDGVVIIPQARAEEILELVKAVAAHEAEMTAEITSEYN
ncbi:RraA family protein [Arthrobacter celericrescens]|uniref:RraA family protein n=1 Tax=Arthrobacter celericrescens TaxID=2320851 RepID=UPI000EA1D1CA|nr:RraA family protein [Arthrobacter celericrescens]